MKKPVILLSGPVGAGKTTVARELIALLQGPVAYIEGDKFWSFIVNGDGHFERLEYFKLTMRAMTVAAIPYARGGCQVLLDFSVPPWYLDVVHKILSARDIPLDYVVLRPDERVCAERAAARTEGKIADYTKYKNLYDSFNDAQRHIIHDNNAEASIIAGYILEGLNDVVFRVK